MAGNHLRRSRRHSRLPLCLLGYRLILGCLRRVGMFGHPTIKSWNHPRWWHCLLRICLPPLRLRFRAFHRCPSRFRRRIRWGYSCMRPPQGQGNTREIVPALESATRGQMLDCCSFLRSSSATGQVVRANPTPKRRRHPDRPGCRALRFSNRKCVCPFLDRAGLPMPLGSARYSASRRGRPRSAR